MKYSTIVEHSEDNLQMILDKASDFEREAILDGVISRRLSLYDVEQLTNDIKEYRAKMKREYLSLVAFGKTFNRQFATDNNKCFETAKILFWKIRSCLSETKRIFLKFCKRCQGQSRYEVNYKASVFSHNILCNKGYMPDLFGEESFPEAVSELCSEMEAFFNELTECIKLCIGILQTEDDTRNDPALLLQIYNKDAEDTRSSQREIIRQISQGKLKIAIDPMSQQKKSTKTLQAFLAETFHKFDTAEFSLHILYTDIEKGLNNGLDETEALLWKNNPDFVPQIRLVIEHFDELDPKGRLDKASGMHKIDGNIMAKFMDWCHISNTGYEKVFIENYFNKHYNGQYLTLKTNTVNTAKNKSHSKHDDKQVEFNQKIEQLLTKYEKEEQRKRNQAVNF